MYTPIVNVILLNIIIESSSNLIDVLSYTKHPQTSTSGCRTGERQNNGCHEVQGLMAPKEQDTHPDTDG